MSEATHTPLPWQVLDDGFTVVSGPHNVADCDPRRDYSQGSQTCAANAAYIVRACNNFPALVEALKLMLESHGMHGPCKHNNCSDCKYFRDKARAALTAAGEAPA